LPWFNELCDTRLQAIVVVVNGRSARWTESGLLDSPPPVRNNLASRVFLARFPHAIQWGGGLWHRRARTHTVEQGNPLAIQFPCSAA
jgi:hypothetical protein